MCGGKEVSERCCCRGPVTLAREVNGVRGVDNRNNNNNCAYSKQLATISTIDNCIAQLLQAAAAAVRSLVRRRTHIIRYPLPPRAETITTATTPLQTQCRPTTNVKFSQTARQVQSIQDVRARALEPLFRRFLINNIIFHSIPILTFKAGSYDRMPVIAVFKINR